MEFKDPYEKLNKPGCFFGYFLRGLYPMYPVIFLDVEKPSMTSSMMGFSGDMDGIYLTPPRMLARQQQDDMLIMFKLGGSHAKPSLVTIAG